MAPARTDPALRLLWLEDRLDEAGVIVREDGSVVWSAVWSGMQRGVLRVQSADDPDPHGWRDIRFDFSVPMDRPLSDTEAVLHEEGMPTAPHWDGLRVQRKAWRCRLGFHKWRDGRCVRWACDWTDPRAMPGPPEPPLHRPVSDGWEDPGKPTTPP